MSKKNKKFKELYEAERERAELEKQVLQQQLQNMDVGFIVFIKSRIKKFLNLFSLLKIKSFKIDSKFKILNSKLSIIVPSLCLLFVVGLVCFFAFAEPADQLPQNQTFLNLAHSHINASTTAPTTYTSTSTHDTQAELQGTSPNIATGFGYHTEDVYPANSVTIKREIFSSEPGLVGLWHMNNDWNDSSGNLNHGTPLPAASPPVFTTSAKLGSAAGSFDGVDDYVSINPAILNNVSSATIEAWIKLNAHAPTSQSPIVVDRTITQSDFQFLVFPDNSNPHKLMFSVWTTGGGADGVSTIDIPLNTWTHVVGVYTGSQALVYINGAQNGSIGSTSGTITSNSSDCRIGGDAFGTPEFNGLIDEVAIYNRALSAAEIQQHYEAGSPAETSFYRSPRFDLGVKTKAVSATITKTTVTATDLKTYIRSGNTQTINTDSIPSSTYRDTSKAEFDAGAGSGWRASQWNYLGPGSQTGTNEIFSSESGLVGLWHMNNDWLDAKGTNNGTRYGTGTPFETVAPKLGTASGKFNGVDDYVNVADHASLDFTSAVTLEAWFQTNGIGLNQGILGKAVTIWSAASYTLQVWNNEVIVFCLSSGGTSVNCLSSSVTAQVGVWYHVVGVFNRPTREIYINGVLMNSDSWDNDIYVGTANLYIGKYAGNSDSFNGLIDEVAVYNRALTASEIQQHYEAGSPAATSSFSSSIIDLGASYAGDLLAIQADVVTGTQISVSARAGNTTGDCSTASWGSWDTPTTFTSTSNNPQILIHNIGVSGSYRCWQYQINGTTDGSATWVVRDVFLIPRATGYGRLQDITTAATNVQNCDGNRYYQWLGIGASNGSAAWDIDKTDLTSKFTAIDLGKRYNIDTLALTDSDDDLYRIHYSLQDENTYASTTSWIDAGDLTASTTLSHTFTGTNGKALRWFRFNRITENTATSSNPQAKAFLAAQPGSALYKLWQGGSSGGFMTRHGSGTTGYYTINPPSTAIGTISASNEYRICNGTIAQTKDFIIKFLRQGDNDGYKIVQLSWDNTHWESYNGTSQTAGAVLDKNSAGYNSATLAKNTEGSCANYKTFYVRTNIPSTGINEGTKNVRFYFEAEGL